MSPFLIDMFRQEKQKNSEGPFQKQYWQSLAKRHQGVREVLQFPKRCDLWSDEALAALRQDGHGEAFTRQQKAWDHHPKAGELWDLYHAWHHVYLAGEHNGKLYIADGTAG